MVLKAAGDPATGAGYHKPQHPKNDFTFHSCPLTNPGSDIRVLGLLPGIFESPIGCTLAFQSLMPATKYDRYPEYEALSYVWGPEEPIDSIKIHTAGHYSGMMNITPDLSAALRQLRDSTSVRFLWIDAICIDQANIQEKNHRVPLIADVYRRAEHVCVMLGQSSDDSHKALQFIVGAGNLIATSAW